MAWLQNPTAEGEATSFWSAGWVFVSHSIVVALNGGHVGDVAHISKNHIQCFSATRMENLVPCGAGCYQI
jgi:hypothetical protein